jgi:hypothetical protein
MKSFYNKRRNFSMSFFMNLAEFVMALMGNDTSERQVIIKTNIK